MWDCSCGAKFNTREDLEWHIEGKSPEMHDEED